MATTVDAPTLNALRELCVKTDSHDAVTCLSGILGRVVDFPDDPKYRRLRAEKLQSFISFSEHFERVLIGFGFRLDDAMEFFVMAAGPLSRAQKNLRGLVLDAEKKEAGMTAAERAAIMESARRRAESAEAERRRIVQQAEEDREERRLKAAKREAGISASSHSPASTGVSAAAAPAVASPSLSMAELAAERAARECAREAAWVNGPRPVADVPLPSPSHDEDNDEEEDEEEDKDDGES